MRPAGGRVIWSDLTAEQQCVVYNAIDEGDLSSLLLMWDPEGAETEPARTMERLGAAVVELYEMGLLQLVPSTESEAPAPLNASGVRTAVAEQGAWIPGPEGLDSVYWLVLTD